jgi:hypothetical protein
VTIGPSAQAHSVSRSFVASGEPHGNDWLLQEIETRLPGR